ncbi:MAG: response regulator [Sinobacteraceae bacterium]|nr:response regulator [Nevskiaceae bacterium]
MPGDFERLQMPPEGVTSAEFRIFAEALPYMAWVCAADGQLRYLNSEGAAYLGREALDSGRLFPPGEIFHEEEREQVRVLWEQAQRSHEKLSVEARLRRADGAFRWHLIRANPVRAEEGSVTKWMGACTDVHAVRESRDLNAFLLQLSTDFARIDNPHELLCTAMLRLRERLAATEVALAELDHPRGEAVILLQGAADGSNLQVTNLRIAHFKPLLLEGGRGLARVISDLRQQDPHTVQMYNAWFGLNGVGAIISAPLLQGGSLAAALSVVDTNPRQWTSAEVELTRRVAEIMWPALEKARSERALTVSEQRLRLAQTVAQIGTWELDPHNETVFFSPEAYELFGLQPDDSDRYRNWTNRIDSRDRDALPMLIADCDASGSAHAEYRYHHPVRGLRWIYCRAGRVRDAGHDFLVGISLDVTERRQAEEALKEVNQRKDEFLAMLAHELRNPLAPIRNAVQILRVHSDDRPQLQWARTIIERQTGHLVRLVDDLLDVSRMIRGKIVLKKSSIELSELIQHALETSQPLIRARRHQLHVNLPAERTMLEGDLTRLAQVIANLLNNAAKYTDEQGEIWLDAWREQERVMVQVRDSGPGIAENLLPHVFDLFTQAERTLDRSQGGLGIGLTLVKLLVEMHGGHVEASNAEQGNGAQFTMSLPATTTAQTSIPAPGPALAGTTPGHRTSASAPMRVLVVDDNIDAADSIALLLSIDGFEAKSVHSALAALEAVHSFSPEVVLLDIGLPVMDGYELAQRLRSDNTIERMKIVALSGYGQPADRERAARAGFDDYLVKPVEPTVLSSFLHTLR